MPRLDLDGKSMVDAMESPRRPLQRSPYPSPVGSTVKREGAHRSPVRTRHDYDSAVSGVEATFLAQRMTAMEDRFSGLESLVSRLAGKLDTFLRTVENDRQVSEALDIRLSSTQDQLSLVQKATVDFGNRIAEQNRTVDRVSQQVPLLESTHQSLSALERRVEDHQRQIRMQADDSARHADALRLQIAQATRLLQSYSRRQCEALSTENAARLDAFEQDRHELIQQVADVSHGMNETRVALGDIRAQLAAVDRTLRIREEGERQHGEEIKVLQRRLLSALRHLSSDASTFLVTPVVAAHDSVPQPPPVFNASEAHRLRGQTSPHSSKNTDAAVWPSSSSPSKPNSALARAMSEHSDLLVATPSAAAAVRHDDEGIDQFLAELNFLSRNAL
jgi:hypothetical protein